MIVETIVTKKTVTALVVMMRIMKKRSRPVDTEINSSVTVETASISDTDVTGTETAEMPVMRMIVMEPVPAVSSTAITATASMGIIGVTAITTAETEVTRKIAQGTIHLLGVVVAGPVMV